MKSPNNSTPFRHMSAAIGGARALVYFLRSFLDLQKGRCDNTLFALSARQKRSYTRVTK
jgi:hypothetical protein